MPSPIIKVTNITHQRDHTILDDLNWTVNPGENWIVMGANGCGKSSLIHMITGYLQPTSGKISVLEGYVDDTNGWPDRRLHIGIVSSHISSLIDEDQLAADVVLTGKDGSLNFWQGTEHSDKAAVRQTIAVLHETHTWDIRDREWQFLSQGEKQRILIARAIMNDAKLLVLDEPCAGLDPAAREHYLAFLDHLMQQRPDLTVIMITHHVEEITPSFTHALQIKDGKPLASGPIQDTLTSQSLSDLFNTEITLEQQNSRHYARVHPAKERIF
ncbi:MAG: ABC transporter ATP-binding protein [Akkermansiaceae bacterium]